MAFCQLVLYHIVSKIQSRRGPKTNATRNSTRKPSGKDANNMQRPIQQEKEQQKNEQIKWFNCIQLQTWTQPRKCSNQEGKINSTQNTKTESNKMQKQNAPTKKAQQTQKPKMDETCDFQSVAGKESRKHSDMGNKTTVWLLMSIWFDGWLWMMGCKCL